MMRDFGNLKKEYQELLAKKTESALATSLERQQQGAQFRVIDPPSLPDKPNSPGSLQVLAGSHRCGYRLGDSVRLRFGVPGRPHPRRAGFGGCHQPAGPGRDSGAVDSQGARNVPAGYRGWPRGHDSDP